MPTPNDQLPAQVQDALKRGSVIEAIKLLRNATGLGLAEAKALIDGNATASSQPRMSTAAAMSIPEVAAALRAGNKIEAIKLLRQHAGIGLKEAKDAVDAASGSIPAPTANGLAPGEIPRSNGIGGWLAIAAIAALAAVLFLMRNGG